MVRFTTVADACELVTDGTHYTPKDIGGGVPFLTVKDVTDASLDFDGCSFISETDYKAADAGNCAPKAGDVLFSKDGTVGKVHVVSTERSFAVLSSLAILRPKNGVVDAQYLGHALRSPAALDEALKRKTGSAIRRIILSDLKKVRFPLPPISEQRRIAAILDQADALRAKRREALAQLDSLTQSIFIDMFGDPVENERGWTVCLLEHVSNKITDGTHKTPNYVASGVEFLSAKDLKNGRIEWGSGKFISEDEHSQLIKRCNPEFGDVLLAKSGSLGAVAVIDREHQFSLFESLCLIKPDVTKINAQFLVGLLRSPSMLSYLLGKNKGIAIKHLHLVDVRNLELPLPPLPVQETYTSRIHSIERLSAAESESLALLDALFASLQHRAFRGEL